MNLPPLNLSFQKSMDSRASQDGAAWDFSQGDWIINLAGSGLSNQSGGSANWLWIAAAAAAAYWVIKK